ncbi:hypothetical protein OV207_22145 [Corallococcus sp. BB11-1]|uniref:hypothetical protein n=1 Tax=Corallococcus sp. BB11-1 TaxID=2996783 RepID=UPI00226EA00F|nr:hypothetical protein [Corallococcus sp. BB11-1]MCY1034172.1 hypothetical protein [Corallococcus sp. BB11-1]
MKRLPTLLACSLLASANVSAAGRGNSTFRYKPSADDERPVVVDATIGPQGSDFGMRLRFDKLPFGEECKQRCANVTLFLDTDASTQSGLQLTTKGPETGADLAVVIQGVREYKRQDAPPEMMLRVKVRQLGTDASSTDGGELLADLNNIQDPERIQLDGNTVYLLVDATSALLPSARKVRVIYHPPGGKAVQATIAGMLGGSSGRGVQIFKHGSGNWGKAPNADPKKSRTPPAGDNG